MFHSLQSLTFLVNRKILSMHVNHLIGQLKWLGEIHFKMSQLRHVWSGKIFPPFSVFSLLITKYGILLYLSQKALKVVFCISYISLYYVIYNIMICLCQRQTSPFSYRNFQVITFCNYRLMWRRFFNPLSTRIFHMPSIRCKTTKKYWSMHNSE